MTTFKQYLNGDVREDDNPFSIRVLTSNNFEWNTNNNKLTLDYKLTAPNLQPTLHLKVKEGFTVEMSFRNTDANSFNSAVNAFHQNGVDDNRVSTTTTGIGGDEIMTARFGGGDSVFADFGAEGGPTMIIKLRRDETQDSGSYQVTENMPRRDMKVKLLDVVKYTEYVAPPDVTTTPSTSTEPSGEVIQTELDPRTNDSALNTVTVTGTEEKENKKFVIGEVGRGLAVIAFMAWLSFLG